MIPHLPLDVIKHIATFLPEREFRRMAVVCKKLRHICRNMYDTFCQGPIDRIIIAKARDIGTAVLFVERGADEKYIKNRLQNCGNGDYLDLRIAGVRKFVLSIPQYKDGGDLFIEVPPFAESLKINCQRTAAHLPQHYRFQLFCNEKSRLRKISRQVRIFDTKNFASLRPSRDVDMLTAMYSMEGGQMRHIVKLSICDDIMKPPLDVWKSIFERALPRYSNLQKVEMYKHMRENYYSIFTEMRECYEELRPVVAASVEFSVKVYCAADGIEPNMYMTTIIMDGGGLWIKTYTDAAAKAVAVCLYTKEYKKNIKSRGLHVIAENHLTPF